ncbi:MAG: His/Gly/Thr/Pro-type tRNA ligase C-terminal domain-containing protein, partial [Bacilli bacterium]|nr:His/Gly/Thr/Pro-type tRNA ligase C-terminal domain-containing protein [Bacilli bacterium]
TKDEVQMNLANKLYNKMLNNKVEVLFDDRDERLGVKLNDIDLIGIPIRILVGRRANENIVEFKLRNNDMSEEINIEEAMSRISI